MVRALAGVSDCDEPRKRKNSFRKKKIGRNFLFAASAANANCGHLHLSKLSYLHFCFLALQGLSEPGKASALSTLWRALVGAFI